MSMFDLKGGGSSNWNYSDPDKAGYMEKITGTVVEISNPQVIDFMTKKPAFWDDGNPKRQLKVVIQGQSGKELAWYIAGKKSAAAQAVLKGLIDFHGDKETISIDELLGLNVTIETKPGSYGLKKPRPWSVTINGEGDTSAVRGLIDLSKPQNNEVKQQLEDNFGAGVNVQEVQPEQPELYATEDVPF